MLVVHVEHYASHKLLKQEGIIARFREKYEASLGEKRGKYGRTKREYVEQNAVLQKKALVDGL